MSDTITLTWNDRKFFITRANLMRARQVIEGVYSLKELAQHMQEDTPHLVRLSMAYGALLRYAGAQVDDEEIYDGMFSSEGTAGAVAANTLFNIMIPQKVLAGEADPQANPTSPSKTSSKSRSAKAG